MQFTIHQDPLNGGRWQARLRNTSSEPWGDLGDAKQTRGEAQALIDVRQGKPVAPSAITCKNCAAKPGEPCTQPTDNGRRPVTWFHDARKDEVDPGWQPTIEEVVS